MTESFYEEFAGTFASCQQSSKKCCETHGCKECPVHTSFNMWVAYEGVVPVPQTTKLMQQDFLFQPISAASLEIFIENCCKLIDMI